MTRHLTQNPTPQGEETGIAHLAAFAHSATPTDVGQGAPNTLLPSAAGRGYFAVEAPALHRAIAGLHARSSGAGNDLSITGRALAGFVGLSVGRRVDVAPAEMAAVERLIHALDDELWFLGGTPGWVASGLLIPLGADPDEAAALTDGVPLADRIAEAAAASARPNAADDPDGDDGDGDDGGANLSGDDGTDHEAFPGLSVLDGNHASAWRAMLRAAAHRYEQADDRLLRWLAFLGDASSPDGVDRLVYGVLASLTAVVDFAENGQEVLLASPPSAASRTGIDLPNMPA